MGSSSPSDLGCVERRGLEAYLQGALRDGTRSLRHGTHRIGQSDRDWLALMRSILHLLGHRGWIYREGRSRAFWVLETSAWFLSLDFDESPLVGDPEGIDYVRGYFDADGGMPRDPRDRLYLQFTQKNRPSLELVRRILESWGIECGLIHNPSRRVDPHYWRFYVRARSHHAFMTAVGSWHPRKRSQIESRLWRAGHVFPNAPSRSSVPLGLAERISLGRTR